MMMATNNMLEMDNLDENSNVTLNEINKQIFEIKKKIQLSEGQRKALFESCDAERKSNADTILRLKRETAEILSEIKKSRGTIDMKELPYKLSEGLPPIVSNKPYDDAYQIVDMKVLDLKKKFDLIKYESKQKEKEMKLLAEKLRELKQKRLNANAVLPDDHPLIKKKIDLENEIHRVNLQATEAEHIRRKYCAIRDHLLSDSVRFENVLKNLEDAIRKQEREIKRLQKVNNDASNMRDEILNILENEQKAALAASKEREERLNESRRKVDARRQELRRLERQIVQDAMKAGPVVVIQQTSEPNSDESEPEEDTVAKNNADMEEALEKLKEATGAMSIPEVLERFQAQRETFLRLRYLRKSAEEKKENVEKEKQKILCELELYKFSSDNQKDESIMQMNKLEEDIQKEKDRLKELEDGLQKHNESLAVISKSFHNLCVSLRCAKYHDTETGENITKDVELAANEPPGEPKYIDELAEMLIERLQSMLTQAEIVDADSGVDETENIPKLVEDVVSSDNNQSKSISNPADEVTIYPPSYTTLTAKSPASVASLHGAAQSALTASEDEDDVPSRGYLKRQAQLIVDAKSRRKAFRI